MLLDFEECALMTAFFTACALVVLAEMGDKTQLLAMAFATKYSWKTVMSGVLLATIFNHLLAVVAGAYLNEFLSPTYIQILASAAFILFGLWTIRGDSLDDEADKTKSSPFWTVTVAFFLAEMGDKTQFATIALAAQFAAIVPVWLGTTTGMMIADGMGIAAGSILQKFVSEKTMKWAAATIFVAFGVVGLCDVFAPATWVAFY